MTMAGFSYKVLGERAIFVFPDTPQKHVRLRRSGDPDVLRLARRRDGSLADSQRHHPSARDSDPADHPGQQGEQHDHRPGLDGGGADPRADDRAERQAEGRDRHRRRDSRSEPGAREAVRPQPVRVRARRRVLAGSLAGRHDRRRRRQRAAPPDDADDSRRLDAAVRAAVAAAVQLQHDHAGCERGRFLPGGADLPHPHARSRTRARSSSRSRSCGAPKAPS